MRLKVARLLSREEAEQILEPFGGIEAATRRGREFETDCRYADAHREELKRLYPDQWVGIRHETVLAHADTAEAVLQALDEAGEDVSVTVLHHASVEEPRWILVPRPAWRGYGGTSRTGCDVRT